MSQGDTGSSAATRKLRADPIRGINGSLHTAPATAGISGAAVTGEALEVLCLSGCVLLRSVCPPGSKSRAPQSCDKADKMNVTSHRVTAAEAYTWCTSSTEYTIRKGNPKESNCTQFFPLFAFDKFVRPSYSSCFKRMNVKTSSLQSS